ncbi:anti-repressor SinI family protein [Virgibacillus sp. SK37]|nr:anti-repressor SinI family protein [Virgibacillus sp. SK37]
MDKEWVALIVEAKQLGLTAEEVSNFLTNKGGKING